MSSNLPNGFSFSVRKSGEVEVLHQGRRAASLQAENAVKFLAKAKRATEQELQHLMARVTGNYKRGNEKAASEHERNP